ncbi:MAG TPA: prepilin-type N-terminal cleavage/methylation domain-containing protein [Candidatus Rifleibacterium sp.]|nr:prepilin-type N-terminal cleavage/methylation domain-containing protein [Candidatus Rifleibacterium sp.]HPT45159.1 prepilin-type N-terminal cleavage/methylation domain-containing protein [Candidatus Rifleibacterium sp.]
MNRAGKIFRRSGQGFSLIEVLLASFIIGVGVVPVLLMFITSTRTVEKGGVLLEASIAAQNIIDRARSDSFLWKSVPVTLVIPDKEFPEFSIPEAFARKYQASGTLSVESAPGHTVLGTGANETNLLQLTVILTWIENGMPKEFRLLTYRANTNSVNLKTSANL